MACGDYGPIIGVPGTPWLSPWSNTDSQWFYTKVTTVSNTNDLTVTGTSPYPATTFRYVSSPAELAGLRQGVKVTDEAEDVEFVRATRDRRSKHYRVTAFFALTVEEAVVIGVGLAWIVVRWWVV